MRRHIISLHKLEKPSVLVGQLFSFVYYFVMLVLIGCHCNLCSCLILQNEASGRLGVLTTPCKNLPGLSMCSWAGILYHLMFPST